LKIVIALGGNALISSKEKGTYKELKDNIKNSIKNLKPILNKNKVVITHGNGREVGVLVLQNEKTSKKIPPMPLDILDAETEGQLGYLIEQQIINQTKRKAITILTQVQVDKKDKAFKNPTKYIGPFYNKTKANKLTKRGYTIKKDSNRGYRRVVPSPQPKKIIPLKTINQLLKSNTLVIATGGGGIPVIRSKNKLKGIEAVIDKDLASSLLAKRIGANLFIIVTDVNGVQINFGQKNEKHLPKTNTKILKKYMKENQFPAGSMGPKIIAAINFLDKKGKKVIITDIKNIKKAIQGKTGTIITK